MGVFLPLSTFILALQIALILINGGSTQSRTGDTGIFSPLLYLLSYRAMMAELTGIEPAIFSVTGRHVNRYTTDPLITGGAREI